MLNDQNFIDTLHERDKIAGMAEAVKVALIRDAGFFAWLERHMDDLATFERRAMAAMIRRCAELHMRQIGQGDMPRVTMVSRETPTPGNERTLLQALFGNIGRFGPNPGGQGSQVGMTAPGAPQPGAAR